MRIGKGCRNCRYRHIKCVIRDGAQGCIRCAKIGRQCDLEPQFSFKNVHHVYQSTGTGRSRFDFAWDDQQVWVKVSAPREYLCFLSVLCSTFFSGFQCFKQFLSTDLLIQIIHSQLCS